MENTRVLQPDSLKRNIIISWLLALLLVIAAAAAGYDLQGADSDATVSINIISARDIFLNNLTMLGLNLLGVFLLGIPNLITGVLNGYALGSYIAAGRLFGPGWALRTILPHGWLEIPVILTAISFGAIPWIYISHRLRFPDRSRRTLRMRLGRYLAIAALACAAALLLAAFIEANISMKLA